MYFTLEIATSAIVYIRRVTKDLMVAIRAEDVAKSKLELATQKEYQEIAQAIVDACHDSVCDLYEELEATGARVLDPRLGIVAFPSIHGHQEIRLVWLYGEDEIFHWLNIGEPVSMAKPIGLLTQQTDAVPAT